MQDLIGFALLMSPILIPLAILGLFAIIDR